MKRILFAILLLLSTGRYCRAEVGLGLGWPYGGVKYNFSEKTALEGRYATGEGVNVYAGRFYWNFSKYDKLNIFTGLEGGSVKFNTLSMKGTGYEGSLFLGGEYFITPKISFLMDLAPTFIGLKSDSYKVSGIEWVANLGLYFYFGSPEGKSEKESAASGRITDKQEEALTEVRPEIPQKPPAVEEGSENNIQRLIKDLGNKDWRARRKAAF